MTWLLDKAALVVGGAYAATWALIIFISLVSVLPLAVVCLLVVPRRGRGRSGS